LFGCASDGYQNVFTQVAPYYNWIESIMDLKHPSMRMAIRKRSLNITALEQLRVLYRCDRKSLSCGCGNSQVELTSSRIFGGEEAMRDSWSMIVSVRLNGSDQHACGGSILNDYFILTAANCVANAPKTSPTGVAVRVEFHRLSEEGALVIIEVDQIFVHPNYIGISDGYQNDIAILHLSEPVGLENNPFSKRTCVPYLSGTMNMLQYPPNGAALAVIGWGMTQQGMNNMSDGLQQAEIVVIDNNDPKCKASIKNNETQFCAGLYNGGKG
jgi:secreted trypsin-like serine protease